MSNRGDPRLNDPYCSGGPSGPIGRRKVRRPLRPTGPLDKIHRRRRRSSSSTEDLESLRSCVLSRDLTPRPFGPRSESGLNGRHLNRFSECFGFPTPSRPGRTYRPSKTLRTSLSPSRTPSLGGSSRSVTRGLRGNPFFLGLFLSCLLYHRL